MGGQELVVVTREGIPGSRAYLRQGVNFASMKPGSAGESSVLIDVEGSSWLLAEDAIINEANPAVRLERLPGRAAYWFGWYAFNPDTLIYIPE